MPNYSEQNTLSLPNFEGPLSFLLHLVRKSEINLFDIPLLQITDQYLRYLIDTPKHDVNAAGEFIDGASSLIWLKSKMLLPNAADEEEFQEYEESSPLDLLPRLVEYCQFKQTAKSLADRMTRHSRRYPKGVEELETEVERTFTIGNVTLEELEKIFLDQLKKAENRLGLIKEEVWRIGDKISAFRKRFKEKRETTFSEMLSETPTKGEVVVTFLAILELMKLGELEAVKSEENPSLILRRHEP